MNGKRLMLALAGGSLGLLVGTAALADECRGLTLTDCKLSIRFRSAPMRTDRLALTCILSTDGAGDVDFVRDGMTISVGDAGAPACFDVPAPLARKGQCYAFQSIDALTGQRSRVRLCPSHDAYRLKVRVTKANLQCLHQQQITVTAVSGDACGGTTCDLASRPTRCTATTTTSVSTTSVPTTTAGSTTSVPTSSIPTTSRVPTTSTVVATRSTVAPTTLRPPTTSTTLPPHSCQIQCADHNGTSTTVTSFQGCIASFGCGTGWNGSQPEGDCGRRSIVYDNDFKNADGSHAAGPAPTYCCARCANRDVHHRATGDNPFPAYPNNCVDLCYQWARSYCRQNPDRGDLVTWLVGDCAP